jgi:pyruvate/2-oxoglutarate dehydrogenase complex dihydrolipoamide acyltransferase (E2) component
MKEVAVPDFGEGVKEVTINHWFFKEGDSVEVGNKLVETISEKGNFTISASVPGTLDEIFFEEGDDVEIGEIIATIEPR